ncbi:alanine--tRNA ligase [Candidatus Pacearchaeota archaeon]|nr:MAG: alanine--tRNA ligase [Candidatus Pacearchaeota archaeon]
MKRKQLIKKYIDFFKSKNHKKIPNSSLIPENDPTVLFTTAGMHPLVPYLLGQPHPLGKRLCGVQRCIRTKDIEEVGDTYHHTFFEMLGNWSLGDYFKKQSIEYSFEFLTKILKIPIKRIAVSVFKGDKEIPKDKEAAEIWMSLGIPKTRIAFLGKKENWWGPAGKTGPCGPDTEIFYWKSKKPIPKEFNPQDKNRIEIWNNVFMQYNKDEKGNYKEAKQKNIDTGMGVERTVTILNNLDDDYLSDSFLPIIKEIEKISKREYNKNEQDTRAMRIIADHLKAAVFIIADGISPSNTEQGYVLRRLIRRAIRYGKFLMIQNDFTRKIGETIIKIYNDYPELKNNKEKILNELEREEKKFRQTLASGLRFFKKISQGKKKLQGKETFLLYQSYGFPLEMIKELAKEKNIIIDEKGFREELKKHQEKSRTAAAGRFKSGLADSSKKTTKLHTATHLLIQALRIILDDKNIEQRGSNITPERLRLDFNFPRKLTQEELQKVEDLVNAQIQDSCEVIKQEMSPEQAKAQGACGIFDKKYGKKVSVYTIKNPKTNKTFSKEICAGPHVKNTCELGHFKIIKEESSSAGVRRIKAVLE